MKLTEREQKTLNTIIRCGDMIGVTRGVTSFTFRWAKENVTEPCPIWKDIRGLIRKDKVFGLPFSALGIPGTHVFVTNYDRFLIDTWNYHPRYIKWLREHNRTEDLCNEFEAVIIEEHGLEWSKQINSMEYKA